MFCGCVSSWTSFLLKCVAVENQIRRFGELLQMTRVSLGATKTRLMLPNSFTVNHLKAVFLLQFFDRRFVRSVFVRVLFCDVVSYPLRKHAYSKI